MAKTMDSQTSGLMFKTTGSGSKVDLSFQLTFHLALKQGFVFNFSEKVHEVSFFLFCKIEMVSYCDFNFSLLLPKQWRMAWKLHFSTLTPAINFNRLHVALQNS